MSVSRTSATAGAPAPRRTYITMRAYNNDIFTYTTSVNNFVTTGTLSAVANATAANCVKGAFLRETGKRLYPGVNPGINTMMVSVFDYATGIHGFIDPNSFAFTPQNTDRAYYIDSAGYNPNSADAPNRSDQGPPVYTHGDVLADGNLYIGGHASTIGNAYVQGNQSTFGNVAVGGNTNMKGTLTVLGDVKFKNATNVGTGGMNGSGAVSYGSYKKVPISGTNYISGTSRVFITLTGNFGITDGNPTAYTYSVEPTGTNSTGGTVPYVQGTFWVVSNNTSDTTSFNYLIINDA
jgi:hypothetical protein